jgi:hypothetical protein
MAANSTSDREIDGERGDDIRHHLVLPLPVVVLVVLHHGEQG